MSKPLCRQNGLYQWNVNVVGAKDGMRQRILVTVFCDTRKEAADAACNHVIALGYTWPTVDHIIKIY